MHNPPKPSPDPTTTPMTEQTYSPPGAPDDLIAEGLTRRQVIQWLDDGTLLTVAQAAHSRGVTRQAIDDLCKRGRLRHIQLERGKLIYAKEIRNLVFHKPGRSPRTPSERANAALRKARKLEPIPKPSKPLTFVQVADCLERELYARVTAYPGRVSSGTLSMENAIEGIAAMREALVLARKEMRRRGEKAPKYNFHRDHLKTLRPYQRLKKGFSKGVDKVVWDDVLSTTALVGSKDPTPELTQENTDYDEPKS